MALRCETLRRGIFQTEPVLALATFLEQILTAFLHAIYQAAANVFYHRNAHKEAFHIIYQRGLSTVRTWSADVREVFKNQQTALCPNLNIMMRHAYLSYMSEYLGNKAETVDIRVTQPALSTTLHIFLCQACADHNVTSAQYLTRNTVGDRALFIETIIRRTMHIALFELHNVRGVHPSGPRDVMSAPVLESADVVPSNPLPRVVVKTKHPIPEHDTDLPHPQHPPAGVPPSRPVPALPAAAVPVHNPLQPIPPQPIPLQPIPPLPIPPPTQPIPPPTMPIPPPTQPIPPPTQPISRPPLLPAAAVPLLPAAASAPASGPGSTALNTAQALNAPSVASESAGPIAAVGPVCPIIQPPALARAALPAPAPALHAPAPAVPTPASDVPASETPSAAPSGMIDASNDASAVTSRAASQPASELPALPSHIFSLQDHLKPRRLQDHGPAAPIIAPATGPVLPPPPPPLPPARASGQSGGSNPPSLDLPPSEQDFGSQLRGILDDPSSGTVTPFDSVSILVERARSTAGPPRKSVFLPGRSVT